VSWAEAAVEITTTLTGVYQAPFRSPGGVPNEGHKNLVQLWPEAASKDDPSCKPWNMHLDQRVCAGCWFLQSWGAIDWIKSLTRCMLCLGLKRKDQKSE
jgi:hypothetical protein